MKMLFLILIFWQLNVLADGFYERAAIDYANSRGENVVVDLQNKINSGEIELKYDEQNGLLKSLLRQLGIPESSQTLVFSKTSFHRKLISPSNPRAMYFNDNAYVAWVGGAEVLEIGVTDKKVGAVFYTLEQSENKLPKFKRDDSCLNCHATGRTGGEPGFVLRSVFPENTGEIFSSAGGERVTHRTER
ncbi:MAG: hypothetical protein HRT88_13895, partial [Lentisphaeraceae bacterium]|nr:hypothetical protein [Lentisphaeraceae bacterium]